MMADLTRLATEQVQGNASWQVCPLKLEWYETG